MNARIQRLLRRAVISCGVVLRRETQSSKFKAQGKAQGASANGVPMDSGFCQRANARGRLDETSRGHAWYGAWRLKLPSNSRDVLLKMTAAPSSGISPALATEAVPLSLAPGFSRVLPGWCEGNRFNGFPHRSWETAEAVVRLSAANTRLKPGANERAAWAIKRRAAGTGSLQSFPRRLESAVPPVQVVPLISELWAWRFFPTRAVPSGGDDTVFPWADCAS